MTNRVITIFGDQMTHTRYCHSTGECYTVTVSKKAWDDWKEGKYFIHQAFPHLSEEQREFLLTGYTPAMWKELINIRRAL